MSSAFTSGKVAVLGDFIAADALLPARHSYLPESEMAKHVLEELGAETNARVRAHSILVVGEAFGYGTGRESPARALSAAGVRVLIGVSFARMFFRNAINNGILAIECPALVRSGIADGDAVEIDLEVNALRCKGRTFDIAPVPAIVRGIVEAGNLIDYGRALLARSA